MAKCVFDSSSVTVSLTINWVSFSAVVGRSKVSTTINAASKVIVKFGWLRAEFTAAQIN